ncbi:hypothetical protein [Sphaerisporangium aureirubrum]|uniref:Heparin-binding hemagglutinin n=1 Tax=Sphaerisporangium aureirubrum TaxID=1544736 RepID=A0ABW1NC22_9ACTN
MPINAEVKKLTDSKPFYAVAGAGDFAVEKLRELPEQIQRLQSRRGEVRDVARELPVMARRYAGNVQVKAEAVAKDLPNLAKVYADQLAARATLLYDQFAGRGRQVVSRVTGEAALELQDASTAAEPPVATRPAKTTQAKATTVKKPARTTGPKA